MKKNNKTFRSYIEMEIYKKVEDLSLEMGCNLSYAAGLLIKIGLKKRDADKIILQDYYDKHRTPLDTLSLLSIKGRVRKGGKKQLIIYVNAEVYKKVEDLSLELECGLSNAAGLLIKIGQEKRDTDKVILQGYYDKHHTPLDTLFLSSIKELREKRKKKKRGERGERKIYQTSALYLEMKHYKIIKDLSLELECGLSNAAGLLIEIGQKKRDTDERILQDYYDKHRIIN